LDPIHDHIPNDKDVVKDVFRMNKKMIVAYVEFLELCIDALNGEVTRWLRKLDDLSAAENLENAD
jgi:hypothetical protein